MKTLYLALAIVSAAFITACSTASYRHTEGAVWGTYYHITYKSDKNLDDSIVAEMERVNKSLSMFDSQSRLERINAHKTDTTDWRIDSVYSCARRVWLLSGGLFDPTVAPLVSLWGFGPDGPRNEPTADVIDSVMASVGMDKLSISGGRIHRSVDDVKLDFGAIAKGFGVDCVADVLRRNGCDDYMVEIGGEVSARGFNPQGRPWRIMIESPRTDAELSSGIIELNNRCVATSGNYRNFYTRPDGSKYGHTINPLTGYPQQGEFLSVTVSAPTCIEADALATACMAMPRQQADSIARRLTDVEIIVVVADGDSLSTKTLERVP